ncbi:hypothetical protein DY000_02009819 [Brassica cretica]|uniref:Uncharacterized protein n=1 Tax=Brassica cretica TaxID=69181 RepID=A0ABQ7C8I1_BRACR|nr:hypothetical protein DY000_02009819 [Brassica cretica]
MTQEDYDLDKKTEMVELMYTLPGVILEQMGHDTPPMHVTNDQQVRNLIELLCKLAGFLKTLEYWQRDKFWDLVSRFFILCLEMLKTSVLGLGQDLGLLLVLEGAMTNSTYVSRFSFILILYRFKVRDRCFAILQGFSLTPAFEKHSGLSTDVCSQNYCSCLDLICDLGVRSKGSRKFVPGKRHPLIPCFAVLSFIAKDVVAKGLDHDTFVLSIRETKPKKLDTEPVRSHLQGDFLLGRDQVE